MIGCKIRAAGMAGPGTSAACWSKTPGLDNNAILRYRHHLATYTMKELADKIGLTVRTLQGWDREGRLKPARTPGNRRVYTDADLPFALQGRGSVPVTGKTVVYLRRS